MTVNPMIKPTARMIMMVILLIPRMVVELEKLDLLNKGIECPPIGRIVIPGGGMAFNKNFIWNKMIINLLQLYHIQS